MQQYIDMAWNAGRDYIVPVIGVLVGVFVAWTVAGMVKRFMLRAFRKANFDETLGRFFANMARYSLMVFAGLGILGYFGIETSSFAAVIAAAGLAIGLAFQGTLSNFAAGVMLLVFRPFKVGDVVTVGGVTGAVQEIELFTVTLVPPHNIQITMPNSAVFGAQITNLTAFDTRRVDIDVGTDYGMACDDVRKVLEKAAPKIPGVLADPAPQVFLAGLGGSSVDWQVRVWCKTADYWDVHQATINHVKMALDAAEIGIPFPQMDVHMDADMVDAMKK